MNIIALAAKMSFLAFFILNGWNQYSDLKTSTATFNKSYQTFEKTVSSRFNLRVPAAISWKALSAHGPFIVQALSLGQILFSVLALMGSSCSFVIVGLIYFAQQLVHLNFAGISTKTSLIEAEQLALSMALLASTFAYCWYSSSCITKITGKVDETLSQVLSDKDTVEKDK